MAPDGLIKSWYPGDQYVDWWGVNIFSGVAAPDCRIMDLHKLSDSLDFALVSRRFTRKARALGDHGCTIAFHDSRASGEAGYLVLSGEAREVTSDEEKQAVWKCVKRGQTRSRPITSAPKGCWLNPPRMTGRPGASSIHQRHRKWSFGNSRRNGWRSLATLRASPMTGNRSQHCARATGKTHCGYCNPGVVIGIGSKTSNGGTPPREC